MEKWLNDIPPEVLFPDVEEIAAHCGIETAINAVKHFGGCRIYIPREWRKDHELNILGENIAKKLVAVLGGSEISVPKRPWTSEGLRILVRQFLAEGLPQFKIARRLDISMRVIRDITKGKNLISHKRALYLDSRQLDLEDFLNPNGRRAR